MQISSLDFLYIALAASIISIAVFLNIVLYQVILTIKSSRHIVENLHDYTQDAVNAKNKIKLQALKFTQKFLSFIKKDNIS